MVDAHTPGIAAWLNTDEIKQEIKQIRARNEAAAAAFQTPPKAKKPVRNVQKRPTTGKNKIGKKLSGASGKSPSGTSKSPTSKSPGASGNSSGKKRKKPQAGANLPSTIKKARTKKTKTT